MTLIAFCCTRQSSAAVRGWTDRRTLPSTLSPSLSVQSVRAGFNSWILDSRRVTDLTMEKKSQSISIKQPSTNYGITHLLENKFMHIKNRVNPKIDARTSPLAFRHYRLIIYCMCLFSSMCGTIHLYILILKVWFYGNVKFDWIEAGICA